MPRSQVSSRRTIERWNQTSPNIKWLMLLSAIVSSQDNCELHLPLSVLDEIDNGNSLSVAFENDEVVLRYAQRAETYVIQALQPWTSQPNPESQSLPTDSSPASAARRSSMMSDAELAEYERKRAAITEGVRRAREVNPWRTGTTARPQVVAR